MDDQPVATIESNESEIAFRLKVIMARLTLGMVCRDYWGYYNRGLPYLVESVEMFFAERVSRNFVARCGLRMVEWGYENNYYTHSTMELITDYENADDSDKNTSTTNETTN